MALSWKIALVAAVMAGTAWAAQEPVALAPATSQAATRPSQDPVVAANTVTFSNVKYGGPDEKLDVLDIYAPAPATKCPVLIFVHGGEWSRGDKLNVSSKPKYFNENGVIFVSVNYRLSPQDPHPAQVQDVATSIAWVKKHIAEYGGDPEKIVIMGHSAGCHLVTLVTLNPEYLKNAGLVPSDIKGTVAWSGGMYDLADRYKQGGMYKPFIAATFGETPEAQQAGSPMNYVKNAKDSPAFLVASVDDPKGTVSLQASNALIEKINAAGGHATPAVLKNKTHFTANHELGADGDKTAPLLLDFIQTVTRVKPAAK